MGVCSNPEPAIFVILDTLLVHNSISLDLHFSLYIFKDTSILTRGGDDCRVAANHQ